MHVLSHTDAPSEKGMKRQIEKVQDLVHVRNVRISQQDTLGAGSDVSRAHGCDRRSN